MLTGLSGANTAASTSPPLIPPSGDGPGPGKRGKNRKKKIIKKSPEVRRSEARWREAGGGSGRVYLAQGRFTWAGRGKRPELKRRRVRSQSGSRCRPRRGGRA